MRQLASGALALILAALTTVPAAAQRAAQPALPPVNPFAAGGPMEAAGLHIAWEVKNRFRLFRTEADFQRHVAAFRNDGVLGAEQRLAQDSGGRGWATGMVERTCMDTTGRLAETCQRDGERENYLNPQDHRIGVVLAGSIPPGATCEWAFSDGEAAPVNATLPCEEEVKLRVRFRRTTQAVVDIKTPDGNIQRATEDIAVQDFLIAGLGDSIAAGEGNPDRPIALADTGFCYRRFLSGSISEYYRPGRAGYRGDKACNPLGTGAANAVSAAAEWSRHGAVWLSAACHRSLYGYQMRAAIAIAVQNPQIAVTFLPFACSGATIDAGLFDSQRARECPISGPCAGSSPAQLTRLQEALASARRRDPGRNLDLVLLTVGANDIYFSGLVANAIVEASTERGLFDRGGLITEVRESQRILDNDLPGDFAKLRQALKPLTGGNLARVVFVSYGHPALQPDGSACPGGRAGLDVHPAFNADPERMRQIGDYVTTRFLPKIRALATCEAGGNCREPDTDRMTFADSHQPAFARHGLCAISPQDPAFDRECFSARGESFESNLAEAATGPLVCSMRPREFRPYASRARWIRTANDSYFTAMSYPIGPTPGLSPSDIHDAIWGAMSAVYGGAFHPTAEGHAAMADAALPAMRAVLGLQQPASVRSEPLPPMRSEGLPWR